MPAKDTTESPRRSNPEGHSARSHPRIQCPRPGRSAHRRHRGIGQGQQGPPLLLLQKQTGLYAAAIEEVSRPWRSAHSLHWTPNTARANACYVPRSITSTASLPSAIFKVSCSRKWSACAAARAKRCLPWSKTSSSRCWKNYRKPSTRASRPASCVRWIGSRLSIPRWGQMFSIFSARL